MNPVPRQFNTAAELRSNAKSVQQYFRTLPAWQPPAPPAPPEPPPAPESEPEPVCEQAAAPCDPEPTPVITPPASIWPRGPRIRDMVAARYGLTREEIESPLRYMAWVRPRHIAMYLCVRKAGMSSPETGRLFGNRDHSSALHAINRVEQRLATDPQCAADVAEFVRQIEGWSAAERNPGDDPCQT